MSNDKQVKSKQRVADHGEVFTAEREVNAMLDLVRNETERIDSRFLEPACGDGNFLAEILRRKLAVVKKKYAKSPADYEKNAILAVSSIYGVDILQDNVDACRARLFGIWDKAYKTICKKETNDDTRRSVQFILSRNILCGNALSLKRVDIDGRDTSEPIVFSEWAFISGGMLQRSDYTFDKLLAGDDAPRDLFNDKATPESHSFANQLSLFETEQTDESTEGEFIQKYISHYRRVWEHGD